ncbi:MAG: cytochrome P450 [Betaproteobacteria bacterium]|nr:cytochrome P450 [Betaproteobacteria bacterium]
MQARRVTPCWRRHCRRCARRRGTSPTCCGARVAKRLKPFLAGGTFNRAGWHALAHLPTAGGAPFWADLQILRQPLAFTRAVQTSLGPMARTVIGGQPQVLMLSATALEAVLLDRDRVFSAKGGWASLMGALFPRGLLLRDGDEHRHHRRLLLPSMKREALQAYVQRMVAPIQYTVTQWLQAGQLPGLGLPTMRHLALSRAADLLLALHDTAEVRQAEHDFGELVEASTALLRLPLIGRRWTRGLQARARLVAQLASLTQARRAQPGPDLLSQLVLARDEDGHQLQDDEIVDHLVFLMMAAHDTTASALTSSLTLLAQHPPWQQRLRDELAEEDPAQDLMSRLASRRQMGWVIREVLRLNPPVAFLQRQTLSEVEVDGVRLPRGALLTLVPLHVQRDARWWPQPDDFHPERFGDSNLPHAYAWTPFGGGAHLCLGLHLAEAQMRLVLGELLARAELHLPTGLLPQWRHAPITHPVQRQPLLLKPLG